MLLNEDGSLNALGILDYPLAAPDFIVNSRHLRWVYNGGDMNDIANWTELPPTEQIEEIELP